MNVAPEPDFAHLLRMTDGRGTFEHAEFDQPRPEHGYCTDDMARVLVVSAREADPVPDVARLVALSLRFLDDAQDPDGSYRNRMSRDGRWERRATTEDCWGRSIWGLGTAIARVDDERVRHDAAAQFDCAARRRSCHPRAMAFATLGAAEVLMAQPDHAVARALVTDAADAMPPPQSNGAWPWPETRLRYANAAVPESMIRAGEVLGRPTLVHEGLALLAWLLHRETRGDHLSLTPAGGSAPGDHAPGFDQQPIEAAALADACRRAAVVDDTHDWYGGVAAAVAWFLGENDGNVTMWDPATGGAFDGLQESGANENQGAESTLALLSTLQHARDLVAAQ